MKKLIFFLIIFLYITNIYAVEGVSSIFDIGLGVKSQTLPTILEGIDDSSTLYFNPSLLDTLRKTEINTGYIPLFFDTNYSFLVIGIPTLDYGGFGFSISQFEVKNIDITNADGDKVETKNSNILEIITGWGRSLFYKNLKVGINMKIDFYNLVEEFKNTQFSIDLGTVYTVLNDNSNNVNIGVVIRNLIEPQSKLVSETDIIPRKYILGLSYKRVLNEFLNISLFFDISYIYDYNFEYKTGCEINLFKNLSIRGGYFNGLYSLGAGININNFIVIDYGVFFTDLGTSHRVSLKVRLFEDVLKKRQEKEKVELLKIEKKAKELAREELKKLKKELEKVKKGITFAIKKHEKKILDREYFKAFHYTNGVEAYFNGDFKLALTEFETVKNIDKNYLNTNYYISLIKGSRQNKVYSKEILRLYRSGVEKYLKEDYIGAKKEWEKILKIDPYNKLAIKNLKEVNEILRNIEGIKEKKK